MSFHPPTVRASLSTNGKPTVLVAEKLGAGGVEMLKEVADVRTVLNMTKEQLLENISTVDAIVIRSATKVSIQMWLVLMYLSVVMVQGTCRLETV